MAPTPVNAPPQAAPVVAKSLAPGRLPQRFGRFALVGGFGAVVNLAVLTLLTELAGFHYLVAAVVGIEASTVLNFAFNRRFTWKDRSTGWSAIFAYHGVVGIGLALQFGVLAGLTGLLGLHYVLATVAGIAAGTAWNFFGHHSLTFAPPDAARSRRFGRAALYGVALVFQLALAALLTHDWDTFVFQKSVEQFLQDGVTPYEVGSEKPDYVYMGVGLPVQPLWYAYPALPLLLMSVTYWPVTSGLLDQPWLARILIKLPFILGNLGLAYVGRRMIQSAPGGAMAAAEKVERFLLFNPLLLLVATIWGMFESVLLVALLGSLWALRERRWTLGGILWGVATLVKIFPLFLVPVLAVHIFRKGGARALARYGFAAAGILLLVSFPFLLFHPWGYIEQVLLMHGRRPPGRFAPIAFLYESLRWASDQWPGFLPTHEGIAHSLSLLSFGATATVLVLLAIASARRPATEGQLLYWCGLSMMAALLATKVLGEQYLLLPLVLLAMLLHHPTPGLAEATMRSIRRLTLSLTACVAVVVPIADLHGILFVAPDVLHFLGATTGPDLIMDLARFLHLTAFQVWAVANGVAVAIMLIPFTFALHVLRQPVGDGLHAVRGFLVRFMQPHPLRAKAARLAVFAILVMVLVPAVVVGVASPRRETAPLGSGVIDGPLVLAHYRTDWFNPTNRFDVQAGNWEDVAFRPTDGYYNSFAHKMTEDIQSMAAHGIDGFVFHFDPVFEARARSAGFVGEQFALPYAMEVDLADIADETGRLGFTSQSAAATRELLDGPGFDYWRGSYHLRLSEDRGPLVFVRDVAAASPSFSDEERRYVAQFVTGKGGGVLGAAQELWRNAPESPEELAAGTPEAALWREAWSRAERAWWMAAVPERENQTAFDFVTDSPAPAALSALSRVAILGQYEPVGAAPDAPHDGGLDIQTSTADPYDVAAYERSWADALETQADCLLLPWNDFDLGQAIEPTFEGGADLLNRTAELTRRTSSTPWTAA